uniref:USP domain-containing protein n=1 Tax=Palpitomonas bilix TaxID=652834 RepID=A0A7S3GIV3_9EUKA|mmetsp:Transcript_5430/g.12264  ORF Transcript_5430/g.12264 Transcript_5430/m.12264 type:complete len:187 (+) Transcript_5430:151-711(+)
MAQIQQGQFNRHRIRHSPQLFSAIDNLSAVAEPLSTPKDLPIGERGIVNMGQTCFIGCVLQGMLHCPPCRGYFLSDKHQRGACAARSKGQLCISCIVDSIYLEAFSSPSPMIVPHNILQALFDKGSHMAGYSMQDSHEFFGELLRLWEANAAENGVADKCPTSKLFEGALVSSLVCENEKCGHKSK